jgi:hypothetical protein
MSVAENAVIYVNGCCFIMKKDDEVIVSTVVEKLKVTNSKVSPKKKKNIQNITKK